MVEQSHYIRGLVVTGLRDDGRERKAKKGKERERKAVGGRKSEGKRNQDIRRREAVFPPLFRRLVHYFFFPPRCNIWKIFP